MANQAFYSSFYATSPLDFKSSAILSSGMVTPLIFYSISKPIETSYIFFGDGLVVYIVLTKVFKANPYPSYNVIFSLYYCFKNEFAATWLVPIAVAFQPA